MDPPPVANRLGGEHETNWKLISAQLREDPGRWYKLAVGSHASAQQPKIGSGKTAYWRPAGAFESCTRRREDGEVELYGRYVGEQPTDAPAEG